MNKPVVIIGIGEMAGVFARGLLRSGYTVQPVTRSMDMQSVAEQVSDPQMVLVAVAEKDLQDTLRSLPGNWKHNTVLLQNELLPRDWAAHQLQDPTIISVWFEKKKGQDYKVLIPSPAYGPQATVLKTALESIGIPCRVLASADDLLHELVLKNVYIVTTNVAGLRTGGTVSQLWAEHETLARQVAHEVIEIQQWLTGRTFDREQLIQGMLVAFDGDPDHQCMGRSAPARLQRALQQADEAGLDTPTLREIQADLS